MKCPKCGYNSFEFLDACKKCGKDLSTMKATFGIKPLGLQGYRGHHRVEVEEEISPSPQQPPPLQTAVSPTAVQPKPGAAPPASRQRATPPAPAKDLEEFSWEEPRQPKTQAHPEKGGEEAEFSLDEFVGFEELQEAKQQEKGRTQQPERPLDEAGFDLEDFFSSNKPPEKPERSIPPLKKEK